MFWKLLSTTAFTDYDILAENKTLQLGLIRIASISSFSSQASVVE